MATTGAEAIVYLDPSRVTDKRRTDPPHNRSRTGYGSKIPSQWLLQLDGKRWHRVYVVCWSNAGSSYVLAGGERQFLGSYEPDAADPDLLVDMPRGPVPKGDK